MVRSAVWCTWRSRLCWSRVWWRRRRWKSCSGRWKPSESGGNPRRLRRSLTNRATARWALTNSIGLRRINDIPASTTRTTITTTTTTTTSTFIIICTITPTINRNIVIVVVVFVVFTSIIAIVSITTIVNTTITLNTTTTTVSGHLPCRAIFLTFFFLPCPEKERRQAEQERQKLSQARQHPQQHGQRGAEQVRRAGSHRRRHSGRVFWCLILPRHVFVLVPQSFLPSLPPTTFPYAFIVMSISWLISPYSVRNGNGPLPVRKREGGQLQNRFSTRTTCCNNSKLRNYSSCLALFCLVWWGFVM